MPVLSLCLALGTAQAQIAAPPSPTATRPVTLTPAPARPSTAQPPLTRSPPVAPVPDSLDDRPQAPKIPAHGPSVPPKAPPPGPPLRVYGANGLPLNGLRQAGPNRVFDPRTGRYHDAVPIGGGQYRLRPQPAPIDP